jgi:uncharacterized protein (DUF2236 family)
MSAKKPASPASRRDQAPPTELLSLLGHFGLAAGNANVIMQLSRLPVGHGVAHSQVGSGRVDKHPLKRLRTTVTYLAIALLGTEHEREVLRAGVNRVHAQVRSQPADAVAYNAFDPGLQLWVASCLYWGTADVYRKLNETDANQERAEVLYQYCKRLGTTLQVTDEMWPADLEAFDEYWQTNVRAIEMDGLTRSYLRGIAQLEFLVAPLGRLGKPLRPLLRPVGRFLTLGWLPEPFRAELGLPWSTRQQRLFELHIRSYAAMTRLLPRPLRQFPVNLYLADARRRIRQGRRIV